MKRRPLRWKIIPDEGGQALTEFVIVIPIVLLFFFAIVQYFSIVQATQLSNYAAFEAARVYAVSGAIDTNAPSEAQYAASIAMAPVARPVPGEIGGNTFVGTSVDSLENDISSLSGGSSIVSDAADYCEGYFMANYVRFNSSLLGGSVTVTNEGSPAQVDVTISYPQPVYIPGLAGLWNFVGHGNIYSSLSPNAQGLTGISGQLLPIYAGNSSLQNFSSELSQYDSGAANSLNSLISSLPTVLLPYVNIQSKCSMGYSSWSGIPRVPPSADATDNSGVNTNDPSGEMQQAQQAQSTYTNDVNTAANDCNALCTAQTNFQNAQNRDDPIISNPQSTELQIAAAQADLDGYANTYTNAQTADTTAQNNLTSAGTALQQYLPGQTLPAPPSCNCNNQ
jgi:hypothetical protein